MKVEWRALYHAEDDNEPYVSMDMLSRNQKSIWFRLWWLLCKWKQTTFTLTITKLAGRVAGPFTVEAHVEGVGEDYADALASKLASLGMVVWIIGSDDIDECHGCRYGSCDTCPVPADRIAQFDITKEQGNEP